MGIVTQRKESWLFYISLLFIGGTERPSILLVAVLYYEAIDDAEVDYNDCVELFNSIIMIVKFRRSFKCRVFSQAEFLSYLSYMAGLVSLCYSFMKMDPKAHSHSLTITGVMFGLASISALVDIIQTVHKEGMWYVYDVLRLLVSVALCVISFTCFDVLFLAES